RIGVVDFYVSRKFPAQDLKRHGWLTRTIWPPWFATDNVFPSHDHLPFLQHQFEQEFLCENSNRLPYVPIIQAPYYVFCGSKEQD
ncbi:MAG: SAM-dependent methyltransferase, partial [Planctomycetota bacterium]